MKLALGTAQFGLNYGVANTLGKISHSSATEIIKYSRSTGIHILDTAISYGESEQCLGSIGVQDFNIVTKLPHLPDTISDIENWMMKEVSASISRLNIKSLYGLMLHRPDQLFGRHGAAIVASLKRLKDMGVIQKVGVSVYSPDEFKDLFLMHDFDLVQCPFNLIDRRLVSSGWLKKLKNSGVEVHVRSTFLQGLLLMPRNKIPQKFQAWSSLWDLWHVWLAKNAVSPIEACLAYVLSESNIDQIVVGVDSKEQLQQITGAIETTCLDAFPDISSLDNGLINPSNWKI
ncbi:aldo/keto reductase [Pseudomonadales bacterium]|nr:aldo/keto reductase [Pseudomonadales bacterium]